MARGERRYLTKVWIGRRWWYLDTRRAYWYTASRWFGIVSYRKPEAEP